MGLPKKLFLPLWLVSRVFIDYEDKAKDGSFTLGHFLHVEYSKYSSDNIPLYTADKFKKTYENLEDIMDFNVKLDVSNGTLGNLKYTITLKPRFSDNIEYTGVQIHNEISKWDALDIIRTKTPLTTAIIDSHLGGGDFKMVDKDGGHTYWELDESGIEVHGCTMCSYEYCDASNLSGLDDSIYIETEEDLIFYNGKTLKEVCIALQIELATKHDHKFPIENYVELTDEERTNLAPLKSDSMGMNELHFSDLVDIVINFANEREHEKYILHSDDEISVDKHKAISIHHMIVQQKASKRFWKIEYERGTSFEDIDVEEVTEVFPIASLSEWDEDNRDTLMSDEKVLFLYKENFKYNGYSFTKAIHHQDCFNIDITKTQIILNIGDEEDNGHGNDCSNISHESWDLTQMTFEQAWNELYKTIKNHINETT